MTLKQKLNMLVQMADLKQLEAQGMKLDDLKDIEKEISAELDKNYENYDYTVTCDDADYLKVRDIDTTFTPEAFAVDYDMMENLKQQAAVANIVERICKNEMNYINSHYSDDTMVYIDGCCSATEEERKLFKEWLERIGGKDYED